MLRDGIRALGPDLVTFQEAIVDGAYDQVVDLLGPGYEVAHQAEREPDGQGISIASRWPLGVVREADLNVSPRTAGFACGCLAAEVRTPDGPLLLVNHFPNWQPELEYERESQAVVAARFVEGLAGGGMPVVVSGDFDAAPEAASMAFWIGRRSLDGMSVCYRDAWEQVNRGEPGYTYTPQNPLMEDEDWPPQRIDYILVRRGSGLEVRGCTRAFVEPVGGVQASDHYGLVADLVPAPGRA